MDLQKPKDTLSARAASPPGFTVLQITTSITTFATQWCISLRTTINPDRHVISLPGLTFPIGFGVCFCFSLMTISNADTCLTWNATDTGIQELLKTSEEVNAVRFVGRYHSLIRPSKTKWTSGKLYTETVLEIQPHRNTLPSLHPFFWQRRRGLWQCVHIVSPNPFCD